MTRSRFEILRRAVETGSYRADPERIADSIISRALARTSSGAAPSGRPTLTAAVMSAAACYPVGKS